MKLSRFCAIFAAVVIPLLSASAQTEVPLDLKPEPGTTGAYAFAFIDHAGDAKIGDHVIIDLRLDGGRDILGSVGGGMLRIRIPFATWVEIEGNMVSDFWKISEATRVRYNIISTQTKRFDGDFNFKTKIRILKESEKRPALGLQVTAKTAAGDFGGTHRYTDSAGYEFSLLASKELFSDDDSLIRKVRFLSEIAFIAWDTNLKEQNDAYKASAAVQVEAKKMKMKVSWLGYYGWQNPSVDYVSSLQLEAAKDVRKNLQVYGQTSIGLTKATTPLLIGGGVRYFMAAPKKKRKKPNFVQP